MSAIVYFTSSDAFLESDPRACEHAEVEARDYVESTYECLRHDENRGETFARFIDGAWELPDGRRFSDWAVKV